MYRLNMVDDGMNIVWVVDDSDACRRLLVVLARRAGASVREFTSAESAILSASDQPWPAAILTDFQMSGQSGIELIRSLRSKGFAGSIALITASPDDSIRDAAQSAGANAVLSKLNMTVAIPWFIEIALRGTGSSAA